MISSEGGDKVIKEATLKNDQCHCHSEQVRRRIYNVTLEILRSTQNDTNGTLVELN